MPRSSGCTLGGMSGPDSPAAQLRGGFIGALAASTTLAAHGLARGDVPDGGALVLLVLGCASVGAVARMPVRGRIAATAAVLVAGQSLGHLLLVAAGHHHGPIVTGSMLAAHAFAAVAGAVLVVLAERLCRSISSVGQWLVRLVTAVGPIIGPPTMASVLPRLHTARPRHVTGAIRPRGPPLFTHS